MRITQDYRILPKRLIHAPEPNEIGPIETQKQDEQSGSLCRSIEDTRRRLVSPTGDLLTQSLFFRY